MLGKSGDRHDFRNLRGGGLTLQRVRFSSDELPGPLEGHSRFHHWRDHVYSTAQIGAIEFGAPSTSPFKAMIEAMPLGPVTYARMVGTINRVARTKQNLRATDRDS